MTLHIRNVPEEVRDRLKQVAERERRSVNAEVVNLLVKALDQPESGVAVKELLRRARELRSLASKRRDRVSSLDLLHRGRRERER